ncbi:MAG: biopolymer transporter ExbD [Acidobacteriia bacterium]|nr:biopolymer transporter ExbD [Terriglobia bacterium]
MAISTPRGTVETSLSEINITPLVDVVLVLLIIFMITAPVLQSSIEVNLPKTKAAKESTEQLVVVTIAKKQVLYVGNDPVKFDQLGNEVKRRTFGLTSQPIYLRIDESVTYGTLATVLDALKQAGFDDAQLVTQPYDKTPGK